MCLQQYEERGRVLDSRFVELEQALNGTYVVCLFKQPFLVCKSSPTMP
jgi:hypothetical protein